MSDTKIATLVFVLLAGGVLLGSVIGHTFTKARYGQPPPKVNVHIIGTANYTAVDTRNESNIIFYVNTNCIAK